VYKVVRRWKYKPDIDELLIVQKNISRQYLPRESQNYIRKILALAFMSNESFLLSTNSHLLNRGISSSLSAVEVKGGILLKDIAKLIDVDYKRLKKLNSHIKRGITPPNRKKCNIYIPYVKLTKFQRDLNHLKEATYIVHIVKPGDTLGAIGRKYNIGYGMIKKMNKLKSNMLSINQRLLIPVVKEAHFGKKRHRYKYKKRYNKNYKIYVVKSGDTLSQIAVRNNIKMKKLMKDNNLKTAFLKIGDKLVIKD
jgi:membrane-bound lytic murein transglycosylase D